MAEMQSPDLFWIIEDVLASHPAFGDSVYIQDQFHVCQMRRLKFVANHISSARKLFAALESVEAIKRYRLLGNTVVRCAIQHAHTQIETNAQYGLSLVECERVFDEAHQYFQREGGGTPLERGKRYLPNEDANSPYGWIWNEEHPDDVFGQAFRYLIKQNYGDPLCTLDSNKVAALMKGAELLHTLLPSLGLRVLSHVHLIGSFSNFSNWKNVGSSSQFKLGGTIFLNQQCLLDPWWVAEHLFHEALHQKLYEFRHGHSVLEPRYLDRNFPSKETVSVWSPWNPEKLKKANYWDTHRTLAAFHVYVHLALLSRIADLRASELERVYGARHGMIEGDKAISRARYLGEQLRGPCWEELGFAGKELVKWLKIILDALDPAPAPAGAYFHLVLDLYDKERKKVESILGSAESSNSALLSKLSFCAKQEIDDTRKLLTSINAGEELTQFDDAVNDYVDADLGTKFSDVRRIIINTLLDMSPNGYELPNWVSQESDPNDLVRQMVRRSSQQLHMVLADLPDAVIAAKQRAEALGFTKACADQVGRLLASLAASVPEGGRIMEIGTGVGVGTAWIITGLGRRTDVEIISIEIDRQLSDAAQSWSWPRNVRIVNADSLDLVKTCGKFDLVFADAVPCKYDYIEYTISLLRPGGSLLVDDLKTRMGRVEANAKKDALRQLLLHHRNLQAVELEWSSGVILAVATGAVP
jgi:predicted O-methyltransferase YrrM